MSQRPDPGSALGPGRDVTILVVDDEPDIRTVVRILGRRHGYRTVEASNGREAVEALGERVASIEAVLLDVTMPVMTGHEALPRLRELVPDLPVILFSGYDRSEVAHHLTEAGAHTEFLPKPFSKDELLDALGRAVTARN